MKIEVGAGVKGRDGYTHVDAVALPGVDVVDDGRWLESFDDGVAEEIFCHWFLEHVAVREIPRMLSAWRRVLQPDGQLRLVTSNQEALNRSVQEGEITWAEWTYITYAAHKPDYNIWDLHKSAWNEEVLRETLDANGFQEINIDARWKCREANGALKCPALIAVGRKPADA